MEADPNTTLEPVQFWWYQPNRPRINLPTNTAPCAAPGAAPEPEHFWFNPHKPRQNLPLFVDENTRWYSSKRYYKDNNDD